MGTTLLGIKSLLIQGCLFFIAVTGHGTLSELIAEQASKANRVFSLGVSESLPGKD